MGFLFSAPCSMPVDLFVKVWYRHVTDLTPTELLTLLAIADTAGMSEQCHWKAEGHILAFKSAQSDEELHETLLALDQKGYVTYEIGGYINICEQNLNFDPRS
jgi:hypothetical protein